MVISPISFLQIPKVEDNIKGQLKERKNAHFMLVDGISKLTTGKVQTYQSSDFHVSGLKWRLLIRPAIGVKDFLSFVLWITDEKCIGSNWEVKFVFKIGIVPRIGPEICYLYAGHHNETSLFQGLNSFISYMDLKERFIVNDKAAFYAEITDVQPNFPVIRIHRAMGTAERFKLIEVPRNNSRFTWKITQFSSFNGENHSSYEFTVGPRRWKLVMYPKGSGEGRGNSLSLYLNASEFVTNGPKGRTLAVFKMKVLDQLHRNHYETDHEDWFPYDPVNLKVCTLGRQNWLPLEELHKASRGLLVNDQIYIGVEFLFVSTTEYL
ncbi:Ubiquitin C-terminal hydrolase 12 [Cardamine amara subsp. amara]|uniref:Ubiquitin C-terminal hydrolase 12 n=1 Tax=Cardamine amara subsp. amara TaxID=228776 RepID=A0ABD1AG18_CARAN